MHRLFRQASAITSDGIGAAIEVHRDEALTCLNSAENIFLSVHVSVQTLRHDKEMRGQKNRNRIEADLATYQSRLRPGNALPLRLRLAISSRKAG